MESIFISIFVSIADAFAWLRGYESGFTYIKKTSAKYQELNEELRSVNTHTEVDVVLQWMNKVENLKRVTGEWVKEVRSLISSENQNSDETARIKEQKWQEIINRVQNMKVDSSEIYSMRQVMEESKDLILDLFIQKNEENKQLLAKTDFLISESQPLVEEGKAILEAAELRKKLQTQIQKQIKEEIKAEYKNWSWIQQAVFVASIKKNTEPTSIALEDFEIRAAKQKQAKLDEIDQENRRQLFAKTAL